MSSILLHKRVARSTAATPTGSNGPVVFTTTGDKFTFAPIKPVDVLRWGMLYSVAKDATSAAFTLDKRPTVGSDTNRVTIGTITDVAARAAGIVVYQEPGTLTTAAATQSTGADGSLVNVEPVGPFHIIPGQELVIAVTDAADVSGQGTLFVEYAEYDFGGTDTAAAVKIVSTT